MKSFMRKSAFLFAALAVFWASPMPYAFSAESTVTLEAVGSSSIYGENVSRARELAIEDGMVAAVEQTVAAQLPVESLIQNFQVLDEILFSDTNDFIQGFKVLTEVKGKDAYRVLVQATISQDLIRKRLSDAGIMVGEKPMPRIVLFLTEQKIGEPAPESCPAQNAGSRMPAAAAAMARALKARGFTILDPEALGRELGVRSLSCRPDFINTEAAAAARSLMADIVVVGKSKAALAANTMGDQIRSFSGEIEVRAIRTDTAETIAAVNEKAVVTGTDQAAGSRSALTDAGARAAAALAPEVLATWKAEKVVEPVTMKVTGTQNLGHFVMFRRALAGIQGVSELQTREMRADEATLVIKYDGSARDLAEALLRIPFESFGIDIAEEAEKRLRVAFVSK